LSLFFVDKSYSYQDVDTWRARVNTGFNNFIAGAASSQGLIGGTINFQFREDLETGVEVNFGGNFSEFSFVLNDFLNKNYWVGLFIGPASENKASGLCWGPHAGYDYFLNPTQSLGMEFQYGFVQFSEGINKGQNANASFVNFLMNFSQRF